QPGRTSQETGDHSIATLLDQVNQFNLDRVRALGKEADEVSSSAAGALAVASDHVAGSVPPSPGLTGTRRFANAAFLWTGVVMIMAGMTAAIYLWAFRRRGMS